MQADPVEEWRRLSALYSEMGDVEIHELADQINDLTPSAQNVLRDELKKRGLLEDQPAGHAFASLSPQHARDRRTVSHFAPASAEVDGSIEEVEEETPVEFSWKTLLCECAEMPEARAIARVLEHFSTRCTL
jgi:hypothetical protein